MRTPWPNRSVHPTAAKARRRVTLESLGLLTNEPRPLQVMERNTWTSIK